MRHRARISSSIYNRMSEPIVAAAPASAPPQIEVEVKLPKKEKKPRSDAQKAATEKALNVLRERREAKAKEEAAVAEAKEITRVQVHHHKRKNPGKELATKEDLESLRGELASVRSLLGKPAESKPAAAPAAPAPAASLAAPAPAAPKPAAKVQSRPTSAERLTGHALLDSLFPPGRR